MASSCFIGTESLEPSGKTTEELLDLYSKNYGMIRRKAAEPRYLLCIPNLVEAPPERKPVIIGDWY